MAGGKAPVSLVQEGRTVPGDADAISLRFELWQTLGSRLGGVAFDEVMVTPEPELPVWFDGDSGGCEWLGPQHNSPSRHSRSPRTSSSGSSGSRRSCITSR